MHPSMNARTNSPKVPPTTSPTRLFQLSLELLALNPNRGTLVDVTRDGQRLLLIMPVQESAQRELGVILTWQESLRKQTMPPEQA